MIDFHGLYGHFSIFAALSKDYFEFIFVKKLRLAASFAFQSRKALQKQ